MDPSDIETPKSAWADLIEEDACKQTEYTYKGKKINIVSTYDIEKKIEQDLVAKLRDWVKIGDSADDKPGPKPKATLISQEAYMESLGLKKTEPQCQSIVDVADMIAKCHISDDEHWSENFLHKDTTIDSKTVMENKTTTVTATATALVNDLSEEDRMYMLPFMTEAQKSKAIEGFDKSTIRISNLPEWMTKAYLYELVKDIGPCKMYLARDKNTGLCKGFAFVHFQFYDDAFAAVDLLDGFQQNGLVLSAAYAKP